MQFSFRKILVNWLDSFQNFWRRRLANMLEICYFGLVVFWSRVEGSLPFTPWVTSRQVFSMIWIIVGKAVISVRCPNCIVHCSSQICASTNCRTIIHSQFINYFSYQFSIATGALYFSSYIGATKCPFVFTRVLHIRFLSHWHHCKVVFLQFQCKF